MNHWQWSHQIQNCLVSNCACIIYNYWATSHRYLGTNNRSPRSSWQEPETRAGSGSGGGIVSRRASSVSQNSYAGLDVADSACSSPGLVRKPYSEEVSVKAFKKILEGTSKEQKEGDKNRRIEIQEKFMHAKFEELCSLNESSRKGPDLQDYLQDVFSRLSFGEKMNYGHIHNRSEIHTLDSSSDDDQYRLMEDSEPYGKLFPQLYLY